MNLLYRILFGGCTLFSRLPLGILYVLSDLLYFILYYIGRYRRRVVRKNLLNSFPGKSRQEIVRIEKGFYAFFCDYIMETLKMRTISHEEMKRHIRFEGIDELMEKAGPYDLLVGYLGHYCNWEWVASLPLWTGDRLHCAQIYHPLENKAFDDFLLTQRARFGAENIAMKETMRRLVQLRNEGKKTIVGFIADQTPHWNNIHLWMPFLSQETPVFTGPERIAGKIKSLPVYLDISRPKRGYYTVSVKVMEVEKEVQSGFPMTETYMHLLEKTILRAPSYWLWSHNRWKRTRDVYEKKLESREERREKRIRANQVSSNSL